MKDLYVKILSIPASVGILAALAFGGDYAYNQTQANSLRTEATAAAKAYEGYIQTHKIETPNSYTFGTNPNCGTTTEVAPADLAKIIKVTGQYNCISINGAKGDYFVYAYSTLAALPGDMSIQISNDGKTITTVTDNIQTAKPIKEVAHQPAQEN